MTKRTSSGVVVPVAVAIVGGIIALVMVFSGADDDTETERRTADPAASTPSETKSRATDEALTLGPADAPVVMVMYSEFQCPYCGKYARDTQPELVERFVADGTLRIEWRDLPFLGSESTLLARAGRAAAAQDHFWAFERRMFADQAPPNSGAHSTESLAEVADELDLDVARFRADLASAEIEDAVRADVDEATRLGLTGTPAFVINGQLLAGAQPIEVFVEVIEQAAAA